MVVQVTTSATPSEFAISANSLSAEATEVGGDGGVDDIDVAGVAEPDGKRVEEAGERVAGDAGAGVEGEGEGDVVGQEAVEEQEAEEKRAGGGEGGSAKDGVDGRSGGEVARGQEDSVSAAEASRLGGGGGGRGGEPGGGPDVKDAAAPHHGPWKMRGGP
nr:unnamed protein product [Digitaria exilis]